jgi:acetylserotonin N-methyltransferase
MTTSPDPAPVVDLIDAFRRSKTMFAAGQLGVFDRTPPTPERSSGCVGLGFLRKEGGRYTNTPVADTYLRRSSPRRLVMLPALSV